MGFAAKPANVSFIDELRRGDYALHEYKSGKLSDKSQSSALAFLASACFNVSWSSHQTSVSQGVSTVKLLLWEASAEN